MTSEELQAGIDSMRELIDNASGTDIASASVRFFRELFDAMDALQAKLNAVPVDEISSWFGYDYPPGFPIAPEVKVIIAWLESQVQP